MQLLNRWGEDGWKILIRFLTIKITLPTFSKPNKEDESNGTQRQNQRAVHGVDSDQRGQEGRQSS
jgi:hypothetical protein